jgi:hypothetical protein
VPLLLVCAPPKLAPRSLLLVKMGDEPIGSGEVLREEMEGFILAI